MFRIVLFAGAVLIAAVFGAQANDMDDLHPRLRVLLEAFFDRDKPPCPYVNTRYSMGDIVPALTWRKEKDSATEFTLFRYYHKYRVATITVFTGGSRFENKCREAAVSVTARAGMVDAALFAGCPGKDYDEPVDMFGVDQYGSVIGMDMQPAWQQRADEFLTEAESLLALCKAQQ